MASRDSEELPWVLRAPRATALCLIGVLIAAAAGVSIAESWRGLYLWAIHHGLPFGWAIIFPLMVDVFITVGELSLFVAVIGAWPNRVKYGAWVMTVVGLGASVAGNVGHIAAGEWQNRLTAAVPPVAAACSLAVGLLVLEQVVAQYRSTSRKPATEPKRARRSTKAKTRRSTSRSTAPEQPKTTAPEQPDSSRERQVQRAREFLATLVPAQYPSARSLAQEYFGSTGGSGQQLAGQLLRDARSEVNGHGLG